MKISVLTAFLCVVLGGVVYSAIVAGKSVKRETLQAHSEKVVNMNTVQLAQAGQQPVDNMIE